MNTDVNRRALSSITKLTLAITIIMTGLVLPGPAAQAQDKPTPVTHTIDYVVTSSTGNTSYVNTTELAAMTTMLSDSWRRMSRGAIAEIKIGRVFTIPNLESVWTFCSLSTSSSVVVNTLGYSPSVYDGPTGRQLVMLNADENASCGWAGTAQVKDTGLSMGSVILARYSTLSMTAGVLAHELGHVFGLKHAGAVPLNCIPAFWDGPFSLATNPGPEWCPIQGAAYDDSASIMGNGGSPLNADLNGFQKYQLGLIQPGAGAIQATAAGQEQLFAIHDVHTPNLDLPQTILMTADDPDGAGPCAAPLYDIDYDPKLGGVRVLRVATPGDCGVSGTIGTVAWTTALGPNNSFSRSYFLPGESRLTQSGKVEVKVVSADPTAGSATVSIRRTDTPGVATLQVTSEHFGSTLPIVANGGQYSGVVTTNQASWSSSSDQSWATVTPSGATGQTVSVSVPPNPTTLERTAVVTLRAGTAISRITVVQAPGDPSIATDCGQSTSSYCPWINTSTPITSSLETAGDKDWFKFTVPTTGSYSFTIGQQGMLTANLYTRDGTLMREAVSSHVLLSTTTISAYLTAGQTYFIEILAPFYTGTYTVTAARAAGTVSVYPQTVAAEPGGNIGGISPKVRISANGIWTAKAPSWVTVTPASGTNTVDVTLTIAGNGAGAARTGSVTFSVDGQDASVTITQAPANDDCRQSAETSCAWSDLSQPITKRIDFIADADWIKITPSTTGTWVFEATTRSVPNLLGSLRTADGALVASGENPDDLYKFKITASLTAGRTYYLEAATSLSWHFGDYTVTATPGTGPVDNLSASPTTVTAAANGGTQDVQVTASGAWTVTGPSWVSVSPSSGTGNTSVRITSTENTTGQTRAGQVTFTTGTKTASVDVTQPAVPVETLSVSPASVNAAAGGDTQTVQITASGSWQITGTDWATASPAYGTGNVKVTLIMTANTSGQPRTGNLPITSGAKTTTLTVTQPAVRDDCGNTVNLHCAWANLDTAVSGTLDYPGDKDWYKFTAPVLGTYTFAASQTATQPVLTTAGRLYASDGATVVASDSSTASSYQFRISAFLTAGQTYYVEISGAGTGNYTVNATIPDSTILSTSTTAYNPDGSGGNQAVQVTCNTSWRVTAPDWIILNTTTGYGNASVTITVTANTTGTARMGSVTFTAGTKTVTLWVNQPAPVNRVATYLTTPITSVVSPSGGLTTRIPVNTDGDWRITTTTGTTVATTTGTGNATVEVTIAPNTSGRTTHGWIIITAGNHTVYVMATQLP